MPETTATSERTIRAGLMEASWWIFARIIIDAAGGHMDELKLAVRRLTKRPGAALASIVTLACAIGAAAATFSLLSAVLLHPLPVDAADRLFIVETTPRSGFGAGKWSDYHLYPLYPQIRDSGIFERVAAAGSW